MAGGAAPPRSKTWTRRSGCKIKANAKRVRIKNSGGVGAAAPPEARRGRGERLEAGRTAKKYS